VGGKVGHTWEPATRPAVTFDKDGTPRWRWVEATLTGGEFNQAFQSLLARAVPEINPRLYTARSLRAGGITAGAASGLPIQQLATCAANKSLESTKIYIRDSLDQRRAHFAQIGG
jgi:hypothetical protein